VGFLKAMTLSSFEGDATIKGSDLITDYKVGTDKFQLAILITNLSDIDAQFTTTVAVTVQRIINVTFWKSLATQLRSRLQMPQLPA
jgi:hypothetical protein